MIHKLNLGGHSIYTLHPRPRHTSYEETTTTQSDGGTCAHRRACRNAILVNTSLVRRNVLEKDKCEYYEQDLEVHHALWKCPCLSAMWDSNQQWNFPRTNHIPRFVNMVQ